MSIICRKTLGDTFDVVMVDHDPSVTSTDATKGSMIIQHNGVTRWWKKTSDGDNTDVCPTALINNYEATTNPSASDDGYDIGSEWLNTSTGKWYKCRDNTDSAAVWDLLN